MFNVKQSEIMRKLGRISIYVAIVVLFVFALIHTLGVGVQTYNLAVGLWEPAVDWAQHGQLKMAIIVGRALALAVMMVLFTIFVINILRSDKGLFVRANSRLLFWSLIPYLIYAFCESNFHIVSGGRFIQIDTGVVLGGGLLLLVSFIYARATLLAEENDLTI